MKIISFLIQDPLEIDVWKGKSGFSAVPHRFDVIGIGKTIEMAIADLFQKFIEEYLRYENTPPEELSVGQKELLDEYRKMIMIT